MKKTLALICILFLSVGAAYAESSVTPANAPLKEWIDTGNTSANNLLCATVGDIGGTGLFGDCSRYKGTAALHKVLKVFNLGVFSIAALFVIWNLLAATMSSANDGDFLGKKNNSTWGPIRFVMGGSMIIPAFGGFNLAQLIMVWATAVGVGIAGAGASTALTNMTMLGKIYSVPANVLKGEEVRKGIIANAECVANWTLAVEKWKADGVTDPAATQLSWGVSSSKLTSSDGNLSIALSFGELTGKGGYGIAECGYALFPVPDSSKWSDPGQKTIFSAVGGVLSQQVPQLAKKITDEYTRVTLGQNDAEISRAIVEQAIADFDSSVDQSAQAAVSASNSQTTSTSVGKSDWIALGFGDVNAAVASAASAKGLNAEVKGSPPKTKAPKDAVKPIMSESDARNRQLQDQIKTQEDIEAKYKKDQLEKAQEADQGDGLFASFNADMNREVGKLGKAVASSLKSSNGDAGGNPLRALIQLGVSLSGWCFTVIVLFLGAALIGVGVSFVAPGIGGFITSLSLMLFGLLTPLLFFGVKLAAYLPFLVAIIWTGAILNWLVIVVEAMFGAPLWAMVHLDLEGDGLNTHRTGHGYIFLLNLLFRPVIMVGAFIFAQLAMSALFGLFLGHITGMLETLAVRSASWWGNLMLIIGAIWVIVIFAEQLVTQCMGLIFQVPDKIFAWVGGHFGSNVGMDMERSVGQGVERMNSGLQNTLQRPWRSSQRRPLTGSGQDGGSTGGGTIMPSDEPNGMQPMKR